MADQLTQAERNSCEAPGRRSVAVRNLSWLGAGLAAVLVLSVTASFAPQIAKRLLLFHALYGAACGFVLSWLAMEIRPRAGRWLLACSFCLVVVGGVNMGWSSYVIFERARRELARDHPEQVAALELAEKIETDPVQRKRYEQEHRNYAPRFPDYLSHRVSGLGNWPAPWPAMFWGCELILAGTLSGLIVRWRLTHSTATG